MSLTGGGLALADPSPVLFGACVGKLKTVQPMMGMAGAAGGRGLSSASGPVAREAQSWRKWYKTARWVKLRRKVLLRDGALCVRCGRQGLLHVPRDGDQSFIMVANHVMPHRGVAALFWDEGNLETVCKGCHDSTIQREEIAGRMR